MPGDKFSVQDDVVRQQSRGLFQLGESPIQPFLTARPQHRCLPSANQLQADPVPLPFEQPLFDVGIRNFLQRGRQKKRKRQRIIRRAVFLGQQSDDERFGWLPLSNHPLRNACRFDAGEGAECFLDETL